MNRRHLLAAGASTLIPLPVMSQTPAKPVPPVARKIPKRIEQLGHVRVDDYAWMKDDNWQKVLRDPTLIKPEVKAHLTAENAYTKAMMASTEPLQAKLFEEMKGRIKEDDSSVPQADGPWDYYSRFETGAQYPLHARRPRGKADGEQILLNEPVEAAGKAFYEVVSGEHSPDHALYAYAVDEQGSEVYRIHVKDLASGALLAGPVESAVGEFVWSPDSAWLFWVYRDDNGRPSKVYRRPARGGAGSDVLVYEEADEGMFVGLGVTPSQAWITINIANQETGEVRLIPASDPTATPKVAEPRRVGVLYSLDHWDGRFVVLTNDDGAVDFKLMAAEEADPSRKGWREWIAHQPGRMIVGLRPYRDHLVRLEKADALNRIVVTARADKAEHAIDFHEEAYALSLDGGYEYATPLTRFIYQSPTTPRQWFDYDMASRQRTLRKTQEIPSGHDPADYLVKRLNAPAQDGASIPIFVVMKKGVALDGSAPLLLYGYGSYGSSNEPTFNARNNLVLVDRGWIYAVACVRGGGEKGRSWFFDGRKFTKKNSFTDFVDCAEHLTANGYGARGRIVANGRSAGGLLMGAITNLAPQMWAGVVAGVPFVDALTTMSDVTLPLTPPEWPEWGDPIHDPKAYDYIASYSPYDNVTAKPYPAVLTTGGLSDPRVTYWEPEKWSAKLRDKTTSGKPVLLKINMDAGHAGSAGRFDYLKEVCLDYAFAIWAMEEGWTTG